MHPEPSQRIEGCSEKRKDGGLPVSDSYTHKIQILTNSLVITGHYELAIYQRFSNAINSEQRRFLPLHDATIAPLASPNHPQSVPSLLFDYREALLIIPLLEAPPPPNYPISEQIREVAPVQVMCFTNGWVLRATFVKRPNLTLLEALDREDDRFLPMNSAHIFPLSGPIPPISADFVAVARDRIAAIYQLPEPPRPPRSASEPPSGSP